MFILTILKKLVIIITITIITILAIAMITKMEIIITINTKFEYKSFQVIFFFKYKT